MAEAPRNYPDLHEHLAALEERGLLRRIDRRIDKDAETAYTVKGVYEAIEPHDRLVFSWAWQRPEAYDSRVVVEFFERDGGTLLVLRHQRLNADDAADHRDGWGMCLGQLHALLQRGH